MLYDLHDEFQHLMDNLTPLLERTHCASWEKSAADLVLPLFQILCKENNPRTKPPSIFSAISENDKIFHPFRISKFQLIHCEEMAIKADEEISMRQQLAIFTIPMLYSPARSAEVAEDAPLQEAGDTRGTPIDSPLKRGLI